MSENQLSNWGRWGADDQKGTLNLLTPELVKAAAELIKTGTVYRLAMPLAADGPQWPTRHKTWKVMIRRGELTGTGGSDDVVTLHSHSGTHMDALCHFWVDNQLYNGFAADEHVTSNGAARNAVDNVPHIVGRAVLLDVARWKGKQHLEVGEAITADDLDKCAEAQDVVVRAGDILLVRTGWMQMFSANRALYDKGEPGLDTSTLQWLKDHDVVAVGADNQAIEVMSQIPPPTLPFHEVAIRDLGIYLLENFNLEAIAADNVRECFFVVAPLPLTGAAGSPINPLAIT